MNSYSYYMRRFNKYIVLITGAGAGIGQSCAQRFAQEGATVLICDINEGGLKDTHEKILEAGGNSESYVFDVSKKSEADSAVDGILRTYGKIDVLIYSAGIVRENSFINIPEDEWRKQIDVNLNGAFYITQPVLKNMIEKRFGKIIYISSKSGLIGRATRTAYSASKFALNGLTQALSLEMAEYGINVNAVCPSRIESQMTKTLLEKRAAKEGKQYEEVRDAYAKTVPIGRLGLPTDVASLTAFLATKEAQYITGQFIATSGGR
jgi:NAD(P)-dependent dehydrogenase (short-subunit alcohol dehydrogenase family)